MERNVINCLNLLIQNQKILASFYKNFQCSVGQFTQRFCDFDCYIPLERQKIIPMHIYMINGNKTTKVQKNILLTDKKINGKIRRQQLSMMMLLLLLLLFQMDVMMCHSTTLEIKASFRCRSWIRFWHGIHTSANQKQEYQTHQESNPNQLLYKQNHY